MEPSVSQIVQRRGIAKPEPFSSSRTNLEKYSDTPKPSVGETNQRLPAA